ncbi:MAG: cation-transporting P-type ATPase [Anaerolineales bacterium]|nr:cation-transporting P-type ATPase [Anaerolineales bacterium]
MPYSPVFSLRPAEVFDALATSLEGLPSSEVAARQSLYGKNILSREAGKSSWQKLLSYAIHPFAGMLWIAGAISFLVKEPVLGIVIWLLVVVNTGFSYWREHRTEQAMQALHRLLPAYARVIRNGVEENVLASELVPGDVLILAEGDNIPADARVVEAYGLRTNNAVLTGEAIPAHKTADASLREGISEVERPNLVFAGTSVVSGTGRAVAYATGMLSQFGRIAHLTQVVRDEPSPFQVELLLVTRGISLIAVGLGVVVFVVGALDVGLELYAAFLLALGIIAAAVPEGLPAMVTLTLAMAGQRLSQRNVLVKKLAVIETLGTVSVVCTDKSGTLTQNQMTVQEIWTGGQRWQVTGVGYEPKGEIIPYSGAEPVKEALQLLLSAATLCNNARLNPPGLNNRRWSALGDQTEAALRVVALKGGLDGDVLARLLPRVHELPFDARRKRMSTVHRLQDGPGSEWLQYWLTQPVQTQGASSQIAFVKGAPREVLDLCTRLVAGKEIIELEGGSREQILARLDEYARHGLRVLALAFRSLPPRIGAYIPSGVERDLTFLGLIAMLDPARPEVAEAVQICKQAGIRMVMITGDYGLTAESLARRIGMLGSEGARILTGAELDELDDAQLQAILHKEVVFARMAPDHKLRLVAAYQSRGEVVAVTGDGVNDAPALRKADIGVAMGLTGTDVAKEAADVILINDNFATIITAIEEGRAVYDNLRKFMTYIFASNVPEILPFLLTALFNIPLALTVRQILAIDLITDMLPGLALGTEKPEPDILRRPPRRRNQPLIDRGLLLRAFAWLGPIEAILAFSGFFLVQAVFGEGITSPFLGGWSMNLSAVLTPLRENQVYPAYLVAITIFHAGVVMGQVGNAFAVRSETHRGRSLGWGSNRFLLVGVGVEIGLIILLIYFQPLANIFQHAPLPPIFWLWLLFYPFTLYGLEWFRKSILRKLKNNNRPINRDTIERSLEMQ